MSESVSLNYNKLTQLQHVKEAPDVWGAVNKVSTKDEYLISDGKCNLTSITYSPLWLKIIDEILVNATDQHVKHPSSVTSIDITFEKNGEISVLNNGPGIPCIIHEEFGVYIPQMILCEFLAGSNFKSIKKNTITGGKNGIGAKLTNAFSQYFIIETSDATNKLYYYQKCTDGLEHIEAPDVKKWKDVDKSLRQEFTRITFMPDYVALGYASYKPDMYDDLYKLMFMRCVLASVYTDADVTLNDELIKYKTMEDIAKTMDGYSDLYSITIKDKYKWDISILITNGELSGHISVINGIYTRKGGSHIDHIVNTIVAPYKEAIKKEHKIKKWNNSMITKYLFILVRLSVDNPSFDSQAKETLTEPSTFDIKIPDKFIKKVYEGVKFHIDVAQYSKMVDKTVKRTTKIHAKKYEKAERAGTADAHKCALFIPEGDSAAGFVKWGLTEKGSPFKGFKYHGIFNIQGKPMNARKEITKKVIKDKEAILRSEKLRNNERLSTLVQILGLDYTCDYAYNDKGEKDFKKLKYGCVIVAVDQDVDGVGHIFGLILNFFHVFWPSLIERGFIKRLSTPLIRAYPKNKKEKVLSFYCDEEYFKWVEETFGSREVKNYTIEYFKGLATHDKPSALDVFKKFEQNLFTYTLEDIEVEYQDAPRVSHTSYASRPTDDKFVVPDNYGSSEYANGMDNMDNMDNADNMDNSDNTERPNNTPNGPQTHTVNLFDVYFGKHTDGRKRELRNPLVQYDKTQRNVSCRNQLRYETKEFFLSDNKRSLPHIIDGLRPAARLVIAGLREIAKSSNSLKKIYQLTGDVTGRMHYQHGDASLNATMVRSAQSYPGARNIPFVYGKGGFGSRNENGEDAGDPRYIKGRLNEELANSMFPPVDDFLLKYRYDDGERCEPLYYVPVIPTALLENISIPGTGWKATIWARDYRDVIKNVRLAITTGEIEPMQYWNNKIDSTVYEYDNKILMVGEAIVEQKNVVKITKLPYGVWAGKWKSEKLGYKKSQSKTANGQKEDTSDPWIDDIINNSNDDVIDITVKMKDGYEAALPEATEELSPLVRYLGLYTKSTHHYNCIGVNDCVYEAEDYEDMFAKWFDQRKKLYKIRIERRIILLKWLIIMYENTIRYSNSYIEYNLSNKSREYADNLFKKNNYVMLNKSHIERPEYVSVKELESYILKDASYEYLLRLSDLDKLDSANNKRIAKLEEFKAELEALNKKDKYFKGASIWLSEIDAVEKCIEAGLRLGWDYGKDTVRYD